LGLIDEVREGEKLMESVARNKMDRKAGLKRVGGDSQL
jgi:hypothetical protein